MTTDTSSPKQKKAKEIKKNYNKLEKKWNLNKLKVNLKKKFVNAQTPNKDITHLHWFK